MRSYPQPKRKRAMIDVSRVHAHSLRPDRPAAIDLAFANRKTVLTNAASSAERGVDASDAPGGLTFPDIFIIYYLM